MELSKQQIAQSAQAGLTLLNLDNTLVPGSMRGQLAVLEVILGGITNGAFVVVPAEAVQVQSRPVSAPISGETQPQRGLENGEVTRQDEETKNAD